MNASAIPVKAMVVDMLGFLCHQFACQNPVAWVAALQEMHQVQGSGHGLDIVDLQDRGKLLLICIAHTMT